ncbi:MAG: baseplate J/gp47 family protein [Anaerolineae bacterium]
MVDVLTIGPTEEPEQVLARLAHARSRQVYLYLPKANKRLRDRLPLTLLRRTADDLGLNLTIVTRDSATRVMAGQVGLRVSWRLDGAWQSASHAQMKSASSPILRPGPLRQAQDVALTSRRGEPVEPSGGISGQVSYPQSPVLSWSSLALAVFLLALGMAVAILVLPHATVVITPLIVSLETTVEIQADPGLTVVDVAGRRIPARRLEVTLEREMREPTAARIDVPDAPARGTVVFVNQSETEVVIPAGSIVSSNGGTGVPFRTQESVTVSGPAGATARVPVEALEPGLGGNVPAYTVTMVDPGLGLPVAVVNDQPMSGGTVSRVGLVTQEERIRVRGALFERTRQEALQVLKAGVHDGETLIDDSIEVQVIDESFSEQAEAVSDVISVHLKVRASGTAVQFDQARQLVEEILRMQIPPSEMVVADSLKAEVGPVLDVADGVVQLRAQATAAAKARIPEHDIKNAVRGRPLEEASILLQEQFPLTTSPIIHMSRSWRGRLPWLPMRIDVIIRNDTTRIG